MTKKSGRSLLATNIVNLRKARGWSQADLAHKVGVHLNTIKTIETDQSEGTFETRMAIAGALEAELSDLYKDQSPSASSPQPDPSWQELSRFVQNYLDAEPERRLLALYILTDDESYLTQYESLPAAPRIAGALKKVL